MRRRRRVPLRIGHPLFVCIVMFEITDVKTAENCVKIIFDTDEALLLSPEVFNMYKLQKGSRVDAVAYRQLKEESDRFQCGRKAINYLSASDRSRLEIENHLNRKGFSKDIINETMMKLENSGYLDDYKFAVNYIHYKKGKKAIGDNLLRRELFRKGVSKNIINKALNHISAEGGDIEALYQLALKKIKSLANKKNSESKLIFFLKQRGFYRKDILAVINSLKK